MKRFIKILSGVLVACMLISCLASCDRGSTSDDGSGDTSSEKKSVGFVTFGLGGDFFQTLADTFVSRFKDAGWDAQYADGQFSPDAQIEACENFIAMKVDVLFIWSVAPEAMDSVVQKAKDNGIKVIDFVAETSFYDVLMVSDDAELADNLCYMAAKWIDETYPDAKDHSVPVAVLSCRTAQTGVVQADRLIKIESISKKAKFVTEVECADENMTTGQEKMENLYTSNPEIKVFLTAHNGLALGINNYFTSVSSPVTNYKDMGIFAINGDNTSAELIQSSIDGKTPFRGMVLTGSVDDTANEMLNMATGIMDGSIKSGFIQKAGTVFVYKDTVEEYLTSGTVKDVTVKDFQ